MQAYLLFKRFCDFVVATIVLLLASPFLILIIGALYVLNDGKPFFTQSRPGKNGVVFKLIKLKTMRDTVDANGDLLPDHERVTRLGSIIRSLSLDELPQLINVIKGEMSLVGPRPLLVRYLELYSPEQSRRHEVRPGITGWAQVNGRNALSWTKKFELDVYYVDNIGFLLDLKILLLTIVKVLNRKGVNSDATTTMAPFTGKE
ncbi:sugar transferase [Phaeocystidibacter luteus]|uniref:Sugar transferase n=1 Tax=Phaeocystidibacter luteus TaxID=911197 RepID=A0A6N6RK75_9FLAO|nr:sugar transferase [Phaeocystidibacter luteus]KAB2814335.1 sugar transferase [Phaeocystidibacter luteus]